MAFAETYRRQVSLLIRTLPHIASEDGARVVDGEEMAPAGETPVEKVLAILITRFGCHFMKTGRQLNPRLSKVLQAAGQ